MKVFAYRSALCRLGDINLVLPKVVKQNGAHELFIRTYFVVVSQQYYYIDCIFCVDIEIDRNSEVPNCTKNRTKNIYTK